MGELTLAAPVAGLTGKGRITADDVLLLRGEVFRDGIVTRAEAESLFALHASCADQCAEWPVFFVEAVTDYIVHQEKPQGYISDDNAEWLMRAISRDGAVDTAVEMELLVSVLEKARSSPERLSAYALEQVALAVIDGNGPLAGGRTATRGVVDKGEVDLLRRVLYAFGGDGNIAITRAEAETLFRINDSTSEELNHPSWNELFVKVVANFVLSSSGYEPPSRTEALRRDAFFDKADASIGGFFARMVSGGVAGILEAYTQPDSLEAGFEDHNRANDVQMRRAETVSAEEARWIADRIGRDHVIRENERALLSFIRQAAPSIHPELKPLLDKLG
jgi:hypothetical protein